MSKNVDQRAADSALTNEPADRATDFTMGKSGDVTHATIVGETSALMRSFGTRDPDFLFGLIHQVANAGSKGEHPDELGFKFMLAFIKGWAPRDQIEAALVAQMAATHVAAMRAANRLAHAESLQEQDSAERTFNKLMRTFAAQVEALQRYRATKEEKAIVRRVSVSDGLLGPRMKRRGRSRCGPGPHFLMRGDLRWRSLANRGRRRFRCGVGKKDEGQPSA